MYILVSLKQQYHLWNRKIESSPQCLRLSGVYTYTLYTVYQFNKKSMSNQWVLRKETSSPRGATYATDDNQNFLIKNAERETCKPIKN